MAVKDCRELEKFRLNSNNFIRSGNYTLPGLLNEYIDYMNKHYFEVKKVKDLRYPYASRI